MKTRPRATYRLQFNEHFRLTDALMLVPYFHELGISHIYASPLFKAAPHSVHGYDVCDFSQLNPELGTEEDLQRLVAALREFDMGLIVDLVPNHMGIATAENTWWQDVLKNGRRSRFAKYFDIWWKSNRPELDGKILVPILGDRYEQILNRGELQFENKNGRPVLRYFNNQLPIAADSIPKNLTAEQLNSDHAALDALLKEQNYCLAAFGEGDLRLNYRRFFAVNTLAAVRVEDEKVFNEVHSLLGQWVQNRWLDGLRIDHPDGLRDPKQYLDRLRVLAPDLWIVVEKILQLGESVPVDWPVEGTVGYDFLNQLNGLFIEAKNKKSLTGFYFQFTGEPIDSGRMVREKKRLVLETLFTTEINRLMKLLTQIAARCAAHQNFSPEQLREALMELAACFPVYRTCVRPAENFVGENDALYIKEATAKAKTSRSDLGPEIFDFLNGLLLLLFHGELESEFVARFQQLTGPAMAKGVEDTTLYCLNYFLSLNEVGGDPGKFGVDIDEFHGFCQKQAKQSPHTMLATSTHDTKRSEDVRARLNVLSEIPDEWQTAVLRWSKTNEPYRKNHFPDRNIEYVLYQTLVGTWPVSLERVLAYMEKASCEAKQHTDWNNRNLQYDETLKNFVTGALANGRFVQDLEKFIASIAEAAQIKSLAQTLIKLTAPGVPDIYQGNELWDFSLVDPDNRRAVDFELRKDLLAKVKKLSAEEAWRYRDQGLPKLWLIHKTLSFRARHEKLFQDNYQPIFLHGGNAGHFIAFVRGHAVMTVVPRFTRSPAGGTPTLPLPDGNWRNEFTRETFAGMVAASELFNKFPVAFLIRE
jgi:(1->4)-alpha-D-glucan 1-alpha-D-glucosylmutase